MKKITFTQDQIKDVIYMFSVNYKPLYIAKKYECSRETIRKLLINNDINTFKQYLYVLESQHLYCKHCNTVKSLDEFNVNTRYKFGKRTICRQCQIKVHKKYSYDRRKTDISYRLCHNLRCRIRHALAGNTKSASTLTLLGCSIEELKSHLQSTALKNGYNDFDINNYSGKDYHVDHICPCSSFNLEDEEEQRKCFHYTNLQILTAKENFKKSDRC